MTAAGLSVNASRPRSLQKKKVMAGSLTPGIKSVNSLLFEYGVGDFYRAFSISQHIDWQKIAAELKNGVLTVHLPKAETVKPKKIAVKGG
jgi:HSP20 family protein